MKRMVCGARDAGGAVVGLELQKQATLLFLHSCLCARVAKGVHVCFMLVCMACLCSPGSLCVHVRSVIMQVPVCSGRWHVYMGLYLCEY